MFYKIARVTSEKFSVSKKYKKKLQMNQHELKINNIAVVLEDSNNTLSQQTDERR